MINGVTGIASGWKTQMYSYDIFDIIKYIKKIIQNEDVTDAYLIPKYKNYSGQIDVIRKEGLLDEIENLTDHEYIDGVLTIRDTTLDTSIIKL